MSMNFAYEIAPPPSFPEPATPWALAELMQLMRELRAHPDDAAAIVRNALDAAGPLADALKLDWERRTRDCVTLADARAGLLELWDLLVRADTGFLRSCTNSQRPGRTEGYAPFIAAVADARALLAPLADAGRERALAPHLEDRWHVAGEPVRPYTDRDDRSGALLEAVERAVAAADAGRADDEAFQDLLETLRSRHPEARRPDGRPDGDHDGDRGADRGGPALLNARRWVYATLQAMFPDPGPGGQRPAPTRPDARRWMPARRVLAYAGTVAPDTPGLGRLRRAIDRAAERREHAGADEADGARVTAAAPVSAADCRIVLATGDIRTFATGFRSCETATGDGTLRLPDEGHLMTIGPTGAGKTTCTIIPTVLRYPGPLIVLDPKGEIEAATRPHRERLGHPVWSIRPDSEESDRINPLETADRRNLVAESDRLAGLLSAHGLVPGHKDPFWDQSALAVLSGYLAHAVADRDGDPAAIPGAASLGDYPVAQAMPPMVRIARWSTSARARAGMYAILGDYTDYSESRTTESIRGVYAHHVRWLHDPAVRRVLGASTIDLGRIRRGLPYTLYVAAPTAHAEVQRPLLRTVIGSLLGLLQQQTARPALNTLLLVDEAHLLGEFEPLRTAVTTLRSYGVQVWTCWQHVAQIQHTWPDWATIVGNARILFQCGVPHPHDLPGHPACPPPPPGAHPISVSVQGKPPATLQAKPYYADPALAGQVNPQSPSGAPGRDAG